MSASRELKALWRGRDPGIHMSLRVFARTWAAQLRNGDPAGDLCRRWLSNKGLNW